MVQLIGAAAAVYAAAGEAEWFISNPAGMALERAIPLRALRERNALAVHELNPGNMPPQIRKYYTAPWRISCSILYENGIRVKTQWVFRDQAQMALFVAAIDNTGSGFIEWYDDQGLLVEEQRLDKDGSGYFVSYSYTDRILLKAEARLVEAVPQEDADAGEGTIDGMDEPVAGISVPDDGDPVPADQNGISGTPSTDLALPGAPGKPPALPEETIPSAAELARSPEGPASIPDFFVATTGREGGPAWTDFYRYTRSKSLRSIERIFHDQDRMPEILRFPRFVEGGPNDIYFIDKPATYIPLFLSDITASAPPKIEYTFDNKRRILTETHRGEDDSVIGEIKNTWENERLASVSWTSPGDVREVLYGYDKAGERISEKNYSNGVLERSVVLDGDHEVETLFKDGREVLRAIWVDGQKVSEERIGRGRITTR